MSEHESHASAAARDRNRLAAVLFLSSFVFAAELAGAFLSNSLALLADAAHVFTDLAGILFALGAIWIAQRPASTGRTFGLLRAEILAAAVNSVVLFGMAALILLEAWRRLLDPPEVESSIMLAVAVVGLAANAVSLYLLRHAQQRSLNVRGAYLEVMGDFGGAAGVIVAALAISLAGLRAADALASGLIALLILPRTWSLLRQAVDVLLEATPRGLDLDEVRRHILSAPGVLDVHDLHAWTITSGQNVLSAHVVVDPSADGPGILDRLHDCLSGDFDIQHCTFQLERRDRRRHERSHA